MSKTPFEIRLDLLTLAHNIISRNGSQMVPVEHVVAAATKLNDFVSNSGTRVTYVDVGNMTPEDAEKALNDIKRSIATADKPSKTKLFENPMDKFAHNLEDFARQAVGLKLDEVSGCCAGKAGCNGGNDTCDCDDTN